MLWRTQLPYRDALYNVSRRAFANGKMSNKVGLQEGAYQDIRAHFGLPAQMACSAPRQVGATCKTLWTRVKAKTAARKAGHTRKLYKGLGQQPKFVSPTLTHQLGHDQRFKMEQHVSILTLDGRVFAPYTGYARHVFLIQHSSNLGAATLWHDKPPKQFYLLVSMEVEVADPSPERHHRIVGVDVGQRHVRRRTITRDFGDACGTKALARLSSVDGGERARETVEARAQPYHQSAHRGHLPAQPDRIGGPDAYPRVEETQARKEGESEAA